MNMDISIPGTELKCAKDFFATYAPYVYQGSVEENKAKTKKIKYRVCRFCGMNSTQVPFNKDAHIISKLLGSKNHFSIEECDLCNEKFGTFENHLARYLGISRTLNPGLNYGKVPSFQSANGNISIKNINGVIDIRRKDLNKDFEFNALNCEFKICMNTQKYNSALVYNALLKMALAIMPAEDIGKYKKAIAFLHQKDYSLYKEIKSVFITECELFQIYPFAMLYKRKTEIDSTEFPLHIFCLQVKNLMFQISFPLHEENIKQKQNKLTVLKAPFVVLGDIDLSDIKTRFCLENFSSLDANSRDNNLTMKINEESLKNAISINLSSLESSSLQFQN